MNKMQSVLDIPDNEIMGICLTLLKGFQLPKTSMTDDEKKIKVIISRVELAEYYLNDLKSRIEKNKRVNESEYNFRVNDLKKAHQALFQLGR